MVDSVLPYNLIWKNTVNKEILLPTISFIKNTKCFERPLLDH